MSFFEFGSILDFFSRIGSYMTRKRDRSRLFVLPFDSNRDLATYKLGENHFRKVLTVEVRNRSSKTAKRCVARFIFSEGGRHLNNKQYGLHWADTPYRISSTSATQVDIGPEGRRLDIVFSDNKYGISGCWLATDYALANPTWNSNLYLEEGHYKGTLIISFEDGQDIYRRVSFQSPHSWDLLSGQFGLD